MNTLQKIFIENRKKSILVIGEIMLDKYEYGIVERISPEAPVPVLKINEKKQMLGGAGNVVRNLSSLGINSTLISIVGTDHDAKKIEQLLLETPFVKHYLLKYPEVTTTTKTRYICNNQQILRTDKENPFRSTPSYEDGIKSLLPLINEHDSIIISDYKKGMLTNKVCGDIINYANARDVPVFVDPKGYDYSMYNGATLIKPNQKELADCFKSHSIVDREACYARKLLQDLNIRYCLITLGKYGMILLDKESEISFKSLEKEVFDVSGAGDTVISALVAAYSKGARIEEAAEISNIAAGIAVGKVGTSVVTWEEIESQLSSDQKIISQQQLDDKVLIWRKKNLKIGFTNGCFDLLHSGHISTIKFAKSHCDKLIVGLNTDASVKMLKGNTRPFIPEFERALILSEFKSIDAIVLFNDKTPESLIERIKPHILVKGADYAKENIVGHSFVESYGGEVLISPLIAGLKSTNIALSIQQRA